MLELANIRYIKDSKSDYLSPQRYLDRSPRMFAMAAESKASNTSSIPQNDIEINTEIQMSFDLSEI